MLTRINQGAEISILPIGLGNHYTSGNHLVPPGRPNFDLSKRSNSIFSRNSIDNNVDDPEAPEANMSFRSQEDYFGPDVLVIIGVVMALGGAILTLVSFYFEFKHPAIQASVAGIGPSLIGIGMLFCVLRLFFCSLFSTRTCCECIGDGLRYMAKTYPIFKKCRRKKKIHPSVLAAKVMTNGQLRMFNSPNEGKPKDVPIEMVTLPDPRTSGMGLPDSDLAIGRSKELKQNLIGRETPDLDMVAALQCQEEEDILKDEMAALDSRLSSADSIKMTNHSISELVLNKNTKT